MPHALCPTVTSLHRQSGCRHWLRQTGTVCLCLMLAGAAVRCPAAAGPADDLPAPAASAARPNIVLILADDLGWSDLGCYGADLHETPHLDQLAADGVQFLQACAMSVCSPSRAALLTGRHPASLRMTIWSEGSRQGPVDRPLLQAESRHDLPLTEVTLAERLQSVGYLTALVGKWHLGDAGHSPETQGFDVNIGGNHWGAPQTYWWPYRGTRRYGGEFRYVPHLEFGHPGEYLTDRLTDVALQVIDRAGSQPFFLFLSHFAPHTPLEAHASDVQYFRDKLRPELQHQHPHYAAMIRSLDHGVGRVRRHLRQRQLADNTIVIFASDNGGSLGIDRLSGHSVPTTSNAPLRSGKGSLYDGGIRVPLIVHWPGLTRPGGRCSEPVILMDLFHTLQALAQTPGTDNQQLPVATTTDPAAAHSPDGLDLTPLLLDPQAQLPRETLFFHYPHYYETTTPVSAVRTRRWKLLEFLEDGQRQLFDLQADPSESTDVTADHPELAARLTRDLHAWRAAVDAAMPTPNPAFKPPR